MNIHLMFRRNMIAVSARAESDDGETMGDMFMTIQPGEDFFGYSYEDLHKLGEGEHNIEPGDANSGGRPQIAETGR